VLRVSWALAQIFSCRWQHASIVLQNVSGELRKTNDLYRTVRSYFKVDDFCNSWKRLCKFLLAISSNVDPSSHRFWHMASYWSKIVNFPHITSVPLYGKFEALFNAIHRWDCACEELRYVCHKIRQADRRTEDIRWHNPIMLMHGARKTHHSDIKETDAASTIPRTVVPLTTALRQYIINLQGI